MKDVFKDYKAGDKVWSIIKGWETIVEIGVLNEYPIKTGCEAYTMSGKRYESDIIPTIYPNKFELVVPDEAYIKPQPKLAVDTKVIVWNNGGNRWERHFVGFTIDGRIMTFPSGTTSFTRRNIASKSLEKWDNYEMYKETDNER